MKTILVPIDGSEYSERALLQAKALADCLGSKIILLNVLSLVSVINYYPNGAGHIQAKFDWTGLLAKAKKKSRDLLEKSKKELGNLEVETMLIEEPSGRIADVIVDVADEKGADLIVMGSNGMGSLRRRLYLGSVTTKVLYTTERPVMVVQ
ncbi:MAG: universal stress protein [Anaerovoracaceae bacterium]|jgi:nucleotide-binding universal stress UspA family protein